MVPGSTAQRTRIKWYSRFAASAAPICIMTRSRSRKFWLPLALLELSAQITVMSLPITADRTSAALRNLPELDASMISRSKRGSDFERGPAPANSPSCSTSTTMREWPRRTMDAAETQPICPRPMRLTFICRPLQVGLPRWLRRGTRPA